MNKDGIDRNRCAALSAAFLTLVFILATFPAAISSAEVNPAKKLLAQSVDAVGGVKAATEWSTRTDKGLLTVIWPGWGKLRANCTRYFKKPDKIKIDRDFSAYDHPFFFTYYYNGDAAWVMVNLGVRQDPRYTSQLAQQMKTIDGTAYYLTKCDTFFLVSNVHDDSLVTAASINRIGVVDNGDTILFDIDKTTLLPVRSIEDAGDTHILRDDYRETGGLKMPYHVTVYQKGKLLSEYKWDEIRFNDKIEDKIFEEFRPQGEKQQQQ